MQAAEATLDAAAPSGAAEMRALLARSDRKGLERLAIHLALLAASSTAVYFAQASLLLIPAMIVQGILIAYLFAPLHECTHYTPFKTRWLSDVVGWWSGTAILWNYDYFHHFHMAHHRYIQDPARDPELASPKPSNLREYLWRLSGLEYLRGNIRAQGAIARGRFDTLSFFPAASRAQARRSVRRQFAVYASLAVVAVWFPMPVFIYWLGPVLLGYPFLLLVLMPEHAGCAETGDNYDNTRTTYTWWPLRLIFWNMSFHAEHHVNPAIPFHALPAAHKLMKPRITHIQPGFVAWNRAYIHELRAGGVTSTAS